MYTAQQTKRVSMPGLGSLHEPTCISTLVSPFLGERRDAQARLSRVHLGGGPLRHRHGGGGEAREAGGHRQERADDRQQEVRPATLEDAAQC
eukprot:2653929-Pleurochrysis_carterae.AAC.1